MVDWNSWWVIKGLSFSIQEALIFVFLKQSSYVSFFFHHEFPIFLNNHAATHPAPDIMCLKIAWFIWLCLCLFQFENLDYVYERHLRLRVDSRLRLQILDWCIWISPHSADFWQTADSVNWVSIEMLINCWSSVGWVSFVTLIECMPLVHDLKIFQIAIYRYSYFQIKTYCQYRVAIIRSNFSLFYLFSEWVSHGHHYFHHTDSSLTDEPVLILLMLWVCRHTAWLVGKALNPQSSQCHHP